MEDDSFGILDEPALYSDNDENPEEEDQKEQKKILTIFRLRGVDFVLHYPACPCCKTRQEAPLMSAGAYKRVPNLVDAAALKRNWLKIRRKIRCSGCGHRILPEIRYYDRTDSDWLTQLQTIQALQEVAPG